MQRKTVVCPYTGTDFTEMKKPVMANDGHIYEGEIKRDAGKKEGIFEQIAKSTIIISPHRPDVSITKESVFSSAHLNSIQKVFQKLIQQKATLESRQKFLKETGANLAVPQLYLQQEISAYEAKNLSLAEENTALKKMGYKENNLDQLPDVRKEPSQAEEKAKGNDEDNDMPECAYTFVPFSEMKKPIIAKEDGRIYEGDGKGIYEAIARAVDRGEKGTKSPFNEQKIIKEDGIFPSDDLVTLQKFYQAFVQENAALMAANRPLEDELQILAPLQKRLTELESQHQSLSKINKLLKEQQKEKRQQLNRINRLKKKNKIQIKRDLTWAEEPPAQQTVYIEIDADLMRRAVEQKDCETLKQYARQLSFSQKSLEFSPTDEFLELVIKNYEEKIFICLMEDFCVSLNKIFIKMLEWIKCHCMGEKARDLYLENIKRALSLVILRGKIDLNNYPEVSVNFEMPQGRIYLTPLCMAIQYKDISLIQWMLENGANPYFQYADSPGALLQSAVNRARKAFHDEKENLDEILRCFKKVKKRAELPIAQPPQTGNAQKQGGLVGVEEQKAQPTVDIQHNLKIISAIEQKDGKAFKKYLRELLYHGVEQKDCGALIKKMGGQVLFPRKGMEFTPSDDFLELVIKNYEEKFLICMIEDFGVNVLKLFERLFQWILGHCVGENHRDLYLENIKKALSWLIERGKINLNLPCIEIPFERPPVFLTPLCVVVKYNNISLIKWMLENGADPYFKYADSPGAPLQSAVERERNVFRSATTPKENLAKVLKCFRKVKKSANLPSTQQQPLQDVEGKTALQRATQQLSASELYSSHGNHVFFKNGQDSDECNQQAIQRPNKARIHKQAHGK